MGIIEDRRSVRHFEEKEIPDESLEQLITAAALAPSALNLQPWYFSIVRDKEKKHEIRKVYDKSTEVVKLANKLHLTNIPIYDQDTSFLETATLIVPCYEKKRVYAKESVCFATENLMLKATELGLVSCCTARALSLRYGQKKIKKILNIPKGYEPKFVVAVGYPLEKEKYSSPKRKEIREVMRIE
ncbi:MAG: nitroreductase family protein [Nanoarchaeota archaeon]|nr:nitroreductase family protein [Nanoarchaeota archaeon]